MSANPMNTHNIQRNFGLIHYLKLADLQAKMKLKSQSKKLILSYLWWVFEPLLFVSMYYLVFELLLSRGGENFLSFLIIGKVIYLWFSKSIISTSKALILNKKVINQCDMPKWVFPLAHTIETSYNTLISFLVLFLFLWINGFMPTLNYIHLIPLTAITLLLIGSIGFVGALLVGFVRDFMNLIRIGMTGLMFLSGVFWDVNSIENESMKEFILLYNPLAVVINSYRDVLMHQNAPDYSQLIPSVLLSLILFLLCFTIFKKCNNSLSRSLFS
ncbi:ABC transporter permease [Vibrio paucivorans]